MAFHPTKLEKDGGSLSEKTEKRGKKGRRRKKGEEKPNRPISPHHLKKLIDACDTLREKAILFILVNIGLRVSDLVRLKWTEFNLTDETFHYVSKKTKKDVYVPIGEETAKLLRRYRKKVKGEYLFPGQKDHLREQRVGQILKKLKEDAGITGRKISPHDFCTTAITTLLKRKVPLGGVAAITGRHPRTISLYYEKYDIEELREWVEHTSPSSIIEGAEEE